jgi:hypothetical protein
MPTYDTAYLLLLKDIILKKQVLHRAIAGSLITGGGGGGGKKRCADRHVFFFRYMQSHPIRLSVAHQETDRADNRASETISQQ